MGNIGISGRGGGRQGEHTPTEQPQTEITPPYPAVQDQYPSPNYPAPYYQQSGVPPLMPYMDHMAQASWHRVGGGRYPCPVMQMPAPYVEQQKAVTIRNEVNLKKESLKIEVDEENPGSFLVSFTFDAMVAASACAAVALNC